MCSMLNKEVNEKNEAIYRKLDSLEPTITALIEINRPTAVLETKLGQIENWISMIKDGGQPATVEISSAKIWRDKLANWWKQYAIILDTAVTSNLLKLQQDRQAQLNERALAQMSFLTSPPTPSFQAFANPSFNFFDNMSSSPSMFYRSNPWSQPMESTSTDLASFIANRNCQKSLGAQPQGILQSPCQNQNRSNIANITKPQVTTEAQSYPLKYSPEPQFLPAANSFLKRQAEKFDQRRRSLSFPRRQSVQQQVKMICTSSTSSSDDEADYISHRLIKDGNKSRSHSVEPNNSSSSGSGGGGNLSRNINVPDLKYSQSGLSISNTCSIFNISPLVDDFMVQPTFDSSVSSSLLTQEDQTPPQEVNVTTQVIDPATITAEIDALRKELAPAFACLPMVQSEADIDSIKKLLQAVAKAWKQITPYRFDAQLQEEVFRFAFEKLPADKQVQYQDNYASKTLFLLTGFLRNEIVTYYAESKRSLPSQQLTLVQNGGFNQNGTPIDPESVILVNDAPAEDQASLLDVAFFCR